MSAKHVETKNLKHVFIMIDRIAGIILPKRAFSSEAEREQFVSELERRAGKARS
jgi:hypothetical protein